MGSSALFSHSLNLRVGVDEKDHIWVGLSALLNQARHPIGFLFYVKGGFLEMIEGFSLGDFPWPERIECYQIVGTRLLEDERGGNLGQSCSV